MNPFYSKHSRFILLSFLTLLIPISRTLAQAASEISIERFSVQIEADFDRQAISGNLRVTATSSGNKFRELHLDAGNLHIDSVRENGVSLAFEKKEKRLRIELPDARNDREYEIEIDYHGTPGFGIKFSSDDYEIIPPANGCPA